MVQRGLKSAGGAGDGSYSDSSIISFKSSVISQILLRIPKNHPSNSVIMSSSVVGTSVAATPAQIRLEARAEQDPS